MRKNDREIYISTDIETDGPIPGPHSLLSFASVATDESGNILGEFEANLFNLPGAAPHPETAQFWKENPEAFAATRTNLRPPQEAMQDYTKWLNALPGKPAFVAYPAGFDFTFMYWYLVKFTGSSPFSFSAVDMKTMAMVLLGTEYRRSTKRVIPRKWFSPTQKHTHVALDDAREQSHLFHQMLKESHKAYALLQNTAVKT